MKQESPTCPVEITMGLIGDKDLESLENHLMELAKKFVQII